MIQSGLADNTVRPARIDSRHWKLPYGIHEAIDAYKRVARDHVSYNHPLVPGSRMKLICTGVGSTKRF